MSTVAPLIIPCPPELRIEALSLVLCEIAPSQRAEIAGSLLVAGTTSAEASSGLLIATRGAELCGATWGQFQPGSTALFWPPRLNTDEPSSTAQQLAAAAVAHLDAAGIAMSQALLRDRHAREASLLEGAGFQFLAELIYLSCERPRFPMAMPALAELQFVAYDETQRGRLSELIEHTYEGTLDCIGLGGQRSMEDVIEGYLATGARPPSNWFIIRENRSGHAGEDVGVLLMAAHAEPRHMELIYMGLVPAARGRGWGRQIAQFAQWVAQRADAERLVLAVDSTNGPGLATYRAANFESWDQRSVFVRFRAHSSNTRA